MNDPPDNQPHNAETVADTGPRWGQTDEHNRFIGRAGPIDLWVDPSDLGRPYLAVFLWRRRDKHLIPRALWATGAEDIIAQTKAKRVHFTLHDECIIHQLCEPHNHKINRKLHRILHGDTQ